ncbi:hypothetical protein GCM10023346_26920 [Arthrobacter gyeryongensis]|uniref:Uncharacterized protein n=1 Tax=Arthrobacter gyeryongensis TaxID=1650592 RepID=A0ABP9SHI0_9MICC
MIDSWGNWSMMDRATVSPPTPESKTPMGRDPSKGLGALLFSVSGLRWDSGAAAAPSPSDTASDAEFMILRE